MTATPAAVLATAALTVAEAYPVHPVDSLCPGLDVPADAVFTRRTVVYGERLVGIVEGNDEHGYAAWYLVPAVQDNGTWAPRDGYRRAEGGPFAFDCPGPWGSATPTAGCPTRSPATPPASCCTSPTAT